MPDKFDPYREALVVEKRTIWPDNLGDVTSEEKHQIAARLHQYPAACQHLEYVRLPTGFSRQIIVTLQDLERLRSD